MCNTNKLNVLAFWPMITENRSRWSGESLVKFRHVDILLRKKCNKS